MKKKFKWKKLIIILIIVVAAVAALTLFVRNRLSKVLNTINPVQLEEVKKQDLSDSISLTGTVSGEAKISYSSCAAAKILTVEVEVGDEVKTGDVIATLDTESIQNQIDTIEKSMSNAAALRDIQAQSNQRNLESAKSSQESQLSQASQEIESANARYAEAEAGVNDLNTQIAALTEQMNASADEEEKAGLAAQIETLKKNLTEAQAALAEADSARLAAQANYSSVKSATDDAIYSAQNAIDMEKYSADDDTSIQAQLNDLKKQLEDCTIVSTGDGIVTAVNVAAGDMNTPNTAIVTVENNQSMVMTASVSETDILKLQEGMKAVVTAEALGEQEIGGEIIKVIRVYNSSAPAASLGEDISASPVSAAGGFSVQIKLDDSELISGMNAKARIILTDKRDVLCVPYDLVKEDESGQSYILCAEEDGSGQWTAVRRDIEIGEEVNYYAEIIGGDIAEGDYVILDYDMEEGTVFAADTSMFDGETGAESDTP